MRKGRRETGRKGRRKDRRETGRDERKGGKRQGRGYGGKARWKGREVQGKEALREE